MDDPKAFMAAARPAIASAQAKSAGQRKPQADEFPDEEHITHWAEWRQPEKREGPGKLQLQIASRCLLYPIAQS